MQKALRTSRAALGLCLGVIGQVLFGPSVLSFLFDALASQLMGPMFLPYCFASLFAYAAEFGAFAVVAAPLVYGALAYAAGFVITAPLRSRLAWTKT